MNKYEMIYCFKPTLDPDSIENAIKNVENNIVNNLKGKIIKTDKLGRKKLAYDVNKFRDGFYATTYFELDPEKIKILKRNMKHNDNIIRELTIRIDDLEQYLNAELPKETDRDRDRDRDRDGRPRHRSRDFDRDHHRRPRDRDRAEAR
ncbi:MAG: 30S ribosomal protein S6 [Cyanobacteriota bacterium]